MESFLELLRIILCWPVAILILSWLFRKELRSLLNEFRSLLSVAGTTLIQRMKTVTFGRAKIEFAEAREQAIKETIENAAAEFKDDPKQLAEYVIEQVRKIVGMRSEPTETKAPLKGRRILWVDDKPEGNTYEANLLRKLGADIQPCVSTTEALEALRNRTYDLVISDVFRMEDGVRNRSAGYDLLDEVKRKWPDLPLIFYTGASRISPTRGQGAFGAAFSPDVLMELVIEAAGA
jgi:CheY-like chemotaxis protein